MVVPRLNDLEQGYWTFKQEVNGMLCRGAEYVQSFPTALGLWGARVDLRPPWNRLRLIEGKRLV